MEARLRRGVELRRAGQDEAAFAEFEAAHALRAEPRTAAQLALVCQATGRWIRAEVLLREALAAPDDGWVRRNRVALQGALAVAERHLATLEVVGGAVEQEAHAQVRLNDEAVGTLPLPGPVRVLAGATALEVRAEGFVPFVRRFEIAPGERVRERVSLVPWRPVTPEPPRVPVEPVPSVPPPSLAPPVMRVAPPVVSSRGEPSSLAPWGGLALGSFIGAGLVLGVGAAALVVREEAVASFNRECERGATAGDCGSWRDRTAFSGGVAVTALPVGLILSAAGTYFMVRRARQVSAVRVAVTGRAFVVQCAWRF